MKQVILKRNTGQRIYQGDHPSFKDAVEFCVREKICLSNSDLSGSDLSGSKLSGSNLPSEHKIISISPIGSENGTLLTFDNLDGKGLIVCRGCFSGTIDEFVAKVKKKHTGTKYEKQYLAAIEFIKTIFGV